MQQDATIYEALTRRLGEAQLRVRLNLQIEHASRVFGQGLTLFHIENAELLMVTLYWMLRLSGLYGVGRRGARNLRIAYNMVEIERLPAAFDGFRILHLSDLHLDLDPDHLGVVTRALEGIDADVAVITGDFRASTSGPYHAAVDLTSSLVGALPQPAYGVLGNHDFVEFVPPLESAGLRILLNETVPVDRGSSRIWISGVDDPHFYEADNLEQAAASIPTGDVSILLAHSPEVYRRAAACGYDLLLCGHTHAGQICLPGGIPILSNARCPRRYKAGAWQRGTLHGYTSAGTGSSGVPVRFFCRPEITVHELRRSAA